MILVTGGTGFVGKALVRQLVEHGYRVRLLIRPSRKSPDLPKGLPVEAAISSLNDERNLRSAMTGVESIIHLASAERKGIHANLLGVDIRGTQAVCQAAAQARVRQIFYVSHLGADRASAFPLLKAKGIAEEYIRRSGVSYTIFRSGFVFGQNDHFSTSIAEMLDRWPFFHFVPGDGLSMIQPLWIEDLVTSLVWSIELDKVRDQTFSIGGPEFLSYNQVLQIIMDKTGLQRRPVHVYPAYLRYITLVGEYVFPEVPINTYWLDYLSTNRTCGLDTLPREFNLLPSRFSHRLDHLNQQGWKKKTTRQPKTAQKRV
jgi:NADH dehydrogenase